MEPLLLCHFKVHKAIIAPGEMREKTMFAVAALNFATSRAVCPGSFKPFC